MDDMGTASTNDPRVTVLWERDGRTVRLGLAVEPEECPRLATDLPSVD
ncbi:hypothetical protein [Streptomyces sp. NBC_01171]|nr:hypothetical protein OG448_15185 [Streptomyces sp. NBC_01171]